MSHTSVSCRREYIPHSNFRRLSLPLWARITVRQTRDSDPYDANVEYIAYCKMSLESNGDLNTKGMGIGMPGDQFIVRILTIILKL
jgi:hypothetical protein